MLDFPALFGPKIKVIGFNGIVCGAPKALKLEMVNELIMRVMPASGGLSGRGRGGTL